MTLGDYLILQQLAAFFNVPIATIYFIESVIGIAVAIIVIVWLRYKNFF